ncbi:S1 family peptidase [Algoriphagus persicinus]|uniref:S1 family peptidase n=1 Tax=Algoriphagus persicinus TaxID=3108754 RepID=UPI002B3B0213|nr:serine protease [Algoriphagus sp. E1-3-M2]MEB2786819.1 serine protease [Algoriphagus sp. E1-3-M2]
MSSEYSTFRNHTFCILKLEKNYFPKPEDADLEFEIKDSGTGFFISKSGHFLTAGHVVSDQENFNYYAVIDRNFYLLTVLQVQYKELKHQSEPMYYDFALGQIDFVSENFFEIHLQDLTKDYKNLLVLGFCKTSQKNPIKEPIIDIEDLFFDEIHILDEREYDGFPCTSFINKFIQEVKLENGEKIGGCFNNGIGINYNYELCCAPKGMSGGPLVNLNENQLVGIFTNGNNVIGKCLLITQEQVSLINKEISKP